MKQTLCDACTKPINTDIGYVQVSWETEDYMVREGFQDYSDKQFHDWQCLSSFAADVELMRLKQQELRETQQKESDIAAQEREEAGRLPVSDEEIVAGIRGHGFTGRREWGILPSPDKRCIRCGIERKDHT